MTRVHEDDSKAGTADSVDANADAATDPRHMMVVQRIRKANAHNRAHADLVTQFNKVTNGSCAGAGGVDARKVIAWQREHNLQGDGKIGPATLQAAHEDGVADDVPAAANARASIAAEPADEEDGLAGELVAGGNTINQEHRPKEDTEEDSKQAGEWAGEGAEKSLEGVVGKGLAKSAATIARMPHVVHLVKEKRYKEAVNYIRDVLGYEDYVEVLKLLAEHMSIPLEEIAEAVPLLGKAGQALEIGAGTVDILLIGYEFQKGALEALAKAKEEGRRDNLIYLYSSAWAHSFLWGAGSYSNPGAIDDRQKQAVVDGSCEGGATAGNLGEKAPEIGKKLLAHYGSPENAEHALVDALLKRAGISGVRFHNVS